MAELVARIGLKDPIGKALANDPLATPSGHPDRNEPATKPSTSHAANFTQGDTGSSTELTESVWNANHSTGARYPSYVQRSRPLLGPSPEESVSLGKAISFGEYFQVGGNQHCFSANNW
jgi:hypothetical protein